MAGSGPGIIGPNRIVEFLEVNFSPNWGAADYPKNPYDGFIGWGISLGESGSITVTRSDGKVLSFEVARDSEFIIEMRENVIRWSATSDFPGSDVPFH